MSSLYKDYLKERENKDILEYDDAFATYEIDGDYIYLVDIYVVPENRRTKRCYQIADKISEIGKEKGCTYLLGSIDPDDKNKDRSELVLKNYGYSFWKHNNGLDWYKKEL